MLRQQKIQKQLQEANPVKQELDEILKQIDENFTKGEILNLLNQKKQDYNSEKKTNISNQRIFEICLIEQALDKAFENVRKDNFIKEDKKPKNLDTPQENEDLKPEPKKEDKKPKNPDNPQKNEDSKPELKKEDQKSLPRTIDDYTNDMFRPKPEKIIDFSKEPDPVRPPNKLRNQDIPSDKPFDINKSDYLYVDPKMPIQPPALFGTRKKDNNPTETEEDINKSLKELVKEAFSINYNCSASIEHKPLDELNINSILFNLASSSKERLV